MDYGTNITSSPYSNYKSGLTSFTPLVFGGNLFNNQMNSQNPLLAYQEMFKQKQNTPPKVTLTKEQEAAMDKRNKDPKMIALYDKISIYCDKMNETENYYNSIKNMFPPNSPMVLMAKTAFEKAEADWRKEVETQEPAIIALNKKYGVD